MTALLESLQRFWESTGIYRTINSLDARWWQTLVMFLIVIVLVYLAIGKGYEPLLLLPIAIVGVLWLNAWAVTPENILAGICSAAVAVYAHQTVKQSAEKEPPDADEYDAGGDLE